MNKVHVQYTNKRARRKPDQLLAALINKMRSSSSSPAIILIGGPGGSGKSTVATMIAKQLGDQSCLLALDDYKTSREFRSSKNIFGPHPEANEMQMIQKHLTMIQRGQDFEKPIYDRKSGNIDQYENFKPKPITIIEGEVATYKDFRPFALLTIFIDAHWETLLQARITRDISQRGYDKDKTIATFLHSNLREFAKYGADGKTHADIHIYCDEDFTFYIESIEENIFHQYQKIFEKSLIEIDTAQTAIDIPIPVETQNKIDLKIFDEYLNALFHEGTHRILVGNFCGEGLAINKKDQKLLLQSACDFFPGEIIFYIKATNLKDATDLIHYAEEYGADQTFVDIGTLKKSFPSKGVAQYKKLLTKPHVVFERPKNIKLNHNPIRAKKEAQKILTSFPLNVLPPFATS